MYKQLKIVLKIGKVKVEMSQTVGVRQGDYMSPVLFFIVIMMFAETLAIEWKYMGLNMLLLRMQTNSPRDSRSLKGKLPKKFSKVVLLELFNVLYVDDGDFPFEDQEQLTLGAQLVFYHFITFGLEMYIRRGRKLSKTECVFFHTPGFFKKKQILPTSKNGMLDALAEIPKTVCDTEEEKWSRRETEYNKLAKTRLIIVANGFIFLCAHFKYL